MKKFVTVIAMLLCVTCAFSATKKAKKTTSSLIKVGVINQPASESGYRAANVADFARVFTKENGYDAKFYYSDKNDEQRAAAQQFITDEVDYLLISAADMSGWASTMRKAKNAGIKVFLFDRDMDVASDLYESAVISDMAKEGETAVAWLKAQKLPEYKVVHIQGLMGSAAQVGRTGALDAEFAKGTMTMVAQQTAAWSESEAKKIVETVINAGKDFNVIYAENDGMAKGAVAALDEAGITHGVDGKVKIMGFDCNKWALKELLDGNWNYDGQCSPFQADLIDQMIKTGKIPSKKYFNEEKGFDAKTITQADIDKYGLGE